MFLELAAFISFGLGILLADSSTALLVLLWILAGICAKLSLVIAETEGERR